MKTVSTECQYQESSKIKYKSSKSQHTKQLCCLCMRARTGGAIASAGYIIMRGFATRCRCRITQKANLAGAKHYVFVVMTDRSGVKQPVGQKFLTNVAVVRYRVKGQEYQATHSRASSVAFVKCLTCYACRSRATKTN